MSLLSLLYLQVFNYTVTCDILAVVKHYWLYADHQMVKSTPVTSVSTHTLNSAALIENV